MASEHALKTQRTAISAALAMLLAAIVLLPLLGHNRLTDWDEGIYAGISRAMLAHNPLSAGTWLVPHWNLQPWLEKPPLELWLTALTFKLFGISELTARLTSALSGILLVGLLHAWLSLRRGALTAWFSTLLLLSTLGFQHVARVGEMDVLLSLGLSLSLIGLAELCTPTSSARAWYLFWVGFAIALMAKGAASATLFFTLLTLLLLDPSLRRRLRSHFFYMFHGFGNLFLDQYLGLHILARATTQLEGHITPWWFYLRVLLVSAAPVVLLYPIALYRALPNRTLRPFALFALFEFTLFTLVQTRLPHYIAPLYPVLSVLTAVWLANWITPQLRASAHPSTLRLKLAASAIALYLLGTLLTATPRKSLHSPRLPSGIVVPDNREQVALLKQVFHHPQPLVANTPGPLLDWRSGTYNPIPTTVFYAGRPVQQVTLTPPPDAPVIYKYTFDPIPLTQAMNTSGSPQPRLILLENTLLPTLPTNLIFRPLATSTTLSLGLLTPIHPPPILGTANKPASFLTQPPISR
jgi:4-amino-4-deoxy-L-arabinose transferase-like glycosyltransferase